MISGVMGVASEDDSLKPLQDVHILVEELQQDLEAAGQVRQVLISSTPQDVLASIPSDYGVPLISKNKKRKRGQRFVKNQIKNILIWAQSNELPPNFTFPHLTSLCVYADPDENDILE